MTRPTMFAVAGPPGSGKSALFPVEAFPDARGFNVDHRCAELNGGSFHGIPPHVRARAGAECEVFILACIKAQQSFAVETTLRTTITLRQAKLAQAAGFHLQLIFICVEDPEENIRRIEARATRGGHSAPPSLIRATYEASLINLVEALGIFDNSLCFDNSARFQNPKLVATCDRVALTLTSTPPPRWLAGLFPHPIPSPLLLTDLLRPTRA